MSRMLGLTSSELGFVMFIFLLVVAAAKLPAWGETVGGYLHRRGASNPSGTRPGEDAPSDR
jgi:Sec-independent protein translocase protein TatA